MNELAATDPTRFEILHQFANQTFHMQPSESAAADRDYLSLCARLCAFPFSISAGCLYVSFQMRDRGSFQ